MAKKDEYGLHELLKKIFGSTIQGQSGLIIKVFGE